MLKTRGDEQEEKTGLGGAWDKAPRHLSRQASLTQLAQPRQSSVERKRQFSTAFPWS